MVQRSAFLFRVLAVACFAGCATAQLDDSSSATQVADTPTLLTRPTLVTDVPVERRIDAHMEFLASDDLGGRETGTLQSLVTAQYVASVFRSIGLLPAGENGGYFQAYPLSANHLLPEGTSLSISAEHADALTLRLFDDFLLRGADAQGFDLAGEVVFADYGIVDATAGVDDYSGLDVAGRFVAVLEGRPKGKDRNALRSASQWRAKREAAQAHGALGLLILTDPDDEGSRQALAAIEDQSRHPAMTMVSTEVMPGWPVALLKGSGAAALFAAGGLVLDAERALRAEALVPGRALSGVRVALKAAVQPELTHANNIAGLLRGSDPELADEYVIVSAHNDHIGISRDGRINNGADDNASGTTTLLAAAEVLAGMPRPRRSVLFLSVSGEEKGLLGSEWWCEHPTLPLDKCIADINIDMVGRNDPDAVGATPSPQHADYNTLVERAVALGASAGLHVTWTAPAASDDRVDNYYQRSDHANFAAKGIPVVFFFSGLHEDYHRPTDTLEKIIPDKLYRMVALVTLLAIDTAEAAQRPAKVKGI